MRVAELCLRPYLLALPSPVRRPRQVICRRQGTLVWLRDGDGRWGVGDAACWPGFGAGEDAVAAALARLPAALVGASVDALLPVAAGPPLPAGPWPSEVVYALESAAVDLWQQGTGADLAALWGAPHCNVVRVHQLVTSASDGQQAARAGVGAVKVKVGAGPLASDLIRVGALRAAVGEAVALRIDANGSWPLARALVAARRLAAFRPAWIEQPVAAPEVAALAEVRRRGGVPVAADEAVTSEAALAALLAAKAADVVVLKPMYVGGLAAARRLAQMARAAGAEVVVTHALESAVGRQVACQLAAALAPEAIHGVGGAGLGGDVGVAAAAALPGQSPVLPGPHFGLQMRAPFRPPAAA